MTVSGFDHVAIPTRQPREMIAFYGALGFEVPRADSVADQPAFEIRFGDQKINVHMPSLWQNERFTLRGPKAQPGCGDFCFVWEASEVDLRQRLTGIGAEIVTGPVHMRGARGPAASLYTRDPDGNLIEFMFYDPQRIDSPVSELKI